MTPRLSSFIRLVAVALALAIASSLFAGCAAKTGSAAPASASPSDTGITKGAKATKNPAAREEAFSKQAVKAGASEAEAAALEKLTADKQIEPKWVIEQLKSGRKTDDIMADINAGKAPKVEKPAKADNKTKKETRSKSKQDGSKKKDTAGNSNPPSS